MVSDTAIMPNKVQIVYNVKCILVGRRTTHMFETNISLERRRPSGIVGQMYAISYRITL